MRSIGSSDRSPTPQPATQLIPQPSTQVLTQVAAQVEAQVAVLTTAKTTPAYEPRVIVPVSNKRNQILQKAVSPSGTRATRFWNGSPKSLLHGRVSVGPGAASARAIQPKLPKSVVLRNDNMRQFLNRLGLPGEVHLSWPALTAACDEVAERSALMQRLWMGTDTSDDVTRSPDRTGQLMAAFESCLDSHADSAVGQLAHMEIVLGLLASPDTLILLASGNRQSCEVFQEMATAVEKFCNRAVQVFANRLENIEANLSWGDIPRLQRLSLHTDNLASLPARAGVWAQQIGMTLHVSAARQFGARVDGLISVLDK